VIVKWVLFFVFWLLIIGWLVLGRVSAKKRVRAGQKPIWGTGWLLPRTERMMVYAWPAPAYSTYPPTAPGGGHHHHHPHYQAYYAPGPGYPMHGNMAPPPVYDPNRPPVYDGVKDGGHPPQQTSGVAPEAYSPPPGPPNAARYS
jgi:hypothetical protein